MRGAKARGGFFQQVLKNVSNLIQSSPTEEEVQALKTSLHQLRAEKERTDALLKLKHSQLTSLKRFKEFNPILNFSLEPPNRAKKPCDVFMSPYKLWFRDQWNQVKSENPNILLKDVMVIMGKKWKALTAEEKKPYEEKCKAKKESYVQVVEQDKRENKALKLLREQEKQKAALYLLEQYLQYRKDGHGDEKSKRKERDSEKPKTPINTFAAFFKERYAALLAETHNGREVLKMLAREWNNMTREKRAPYEQIAAEAKEHYVEKMELYKQKKNEEANLIFIQEEERRKVEREQALRLLKKKEKEEILIKSINKNKQRKEKTTDPNRPKRPLASFLLFRNETRKELVQARPGISNKTISTLICIKWKELGDAEKQIWKDQAASAMVQYKKKIEEYNKKLEQQQKQLEICFHQEEVSLENPTPTTTTM